jgi:hypothetical protein
MSPQREGYSMLELDAIKAGIDVLDSLGLLERLSLKLVSNPDKAARRLSNALGEVESGYTALHTEILELSTLSFELDELNTTRRRLLRVSDGWVADEVLSIKSSCSRISNIYQRYLTGWFSNVLRAEEAQTLAVLFDELACKDEILTQAVKDVSSAAQQFASRVLELLSQGNVAEARSYAREFEKQLTPLREQLTNSMKRLWDLQDRFIKVGRAL